MCGILGKIIFNTSRIDHARFASSLESIVHRGPDDFGIHHGENYSFGFRRLSIIDLSKKGHQPMFSIDKNIIIIFNGEIYNYREIRKVLISKGYSFQSQTDTEVIIQAYREYGIGCVSQFNGMFSFALHDSAINTTYLVRDRLGIKPLYYYKTNSGLTFSSEIKAILSLEEKSFNLNLSAVSSYLSFRYPILNDSFFDEIFSLPPAHIMTIKENDITLNKYWSFSNKINEQSIDKGEIFYIEKLDDLMRSSVKYRMISDVPIGSFLSGGVDSSLITAIMAQESEEPVKTFTIGFSQDGYNEYKFAEIIAERYKTNHVPIEIDGAEYLSTMDALIHFKDAPLGVPNEVPLYLMSKELKKYITVVLSGEGADEIFGGYGRIFRSPDDLEKFNSKEEIFSEKTVRDLYIENYYSKYPRTPFTNQLEHFYWNYSYTKPLDKQLLLNERIFDHCPESKLLKRFEDCISEIPNSSYRNKIHYIFENIHLQGLLNRADMTTMAASVEARVPFVDHRLVEFAFTIPEKYKLKWKNDAARKNSRPLISDQISEHYDIPKYILKKSAEDKLPSEILYRKKMGFPVPLNNWFGNEFNTYAKRVLLDPSNSQQGLLNLKNIESWLSDDKLSRNHGFAMKIWMLINISLFTKKYALS